MPPNRLYYGDNLAVLRQHLLDDSVQLVYLDPPFNSGRRYRTGPGPARGIEAFDDTWSWTPATERDYTALVDQARPGPVGSALRALRVLLGADDRLAYLVALAPRVVEIQRVLAPTGSVFLHCDPTMSHAVKLLLDAVFGAERFRNEIIWHHGLGAMAGRTRFPSKHDVILAYSKGPRPTFRPLRGEVTAAMRAKYVHEDERGRYMLSYGRRYYLKGGKPLDDVWDLPAIAPTSAERVGYPTQKPLALLERIISAASNEGDLVLDPFCGSGTTLAAAQRLGRRWIGIDLTYVAVDLAERRLRPAEGGSPDPGFERLGVAPDAAAGLALFRADPADVARWAPALLLGPAYAPPGARGPDRLVELEPDGTIDPGRLLVSVRPDAVPSLATVAELDRAVRGCGARLGVLIAGRPASRPVLDRLGRADPVRCGAHDYPRLQLLTPDDLLRGRRPMLPSLASATGVPGGSPGPSGPSGPVDNPAR